MIALRRRLGELREEEGELLGSGSGRGTRSGRIAERLGEKYSTVPVRLFRLLRRLESLLEH